MQTIDDFVRKYDVEKTEDEQLILYKALKRLENGNFITLFHNFPYKLGREFCEKNLDQNPAKISSIGIQVGTFDWTTHNRASIYSLTQGNNVLVRAYVPSDTNVCIPYATTGGMRVSRIRLDNQVLSIKELQSLIIRTGHLIDFCQFAYFAKGLDVYELQEKLTGKKDLDFTALVRYVEKEANEKIERELSLL